MFFVLSTGRSGTMSIAKTLSLLHGIVCLHEPPPELILESSAYHCGRIPAGEIKKIIRKTRKPEINGSIYCESNQTLSLLIPVLADLFPSARYIWLIRNGLDVVASAYQKQWYTGHSENHSRYEDGSPIEKAWIDGRIRGDRCHDMSRQKWAELDRFGRCCWYWGYLNRVIENNLNQYASGRYFVLRLEEIDRKLKDLVKWMGIEVAMLPLAERFNPAKREPYHWSKWTLEEKTTFEHFCGGLMNRFYPSWKDASGKWKGVGYYLYGGLLKRIKSNHKMVKNLNDILARNERK